MDDAPDTSYVKIDTASGRDDCLMDEVEGQSPSPPGDVSSLTIPPRPRKKKRGGGGGGRTTAAAPTIDAGFGVCEEEPTRTFSQYHPPDDHRPPRRRPSDDKHAAVAAATMTSIKTMAAGAAAAGVVGGALASDGGSSGKKKHLVGVAVAVGLGALYLGLLYVLYQRIKSMEGSLQEAIGEIQKLKVLLDSDEELEDQPLPLREAMDLLSERFGRMATMSPVDEADEDEDEDEDDDDDDEDHDDDDEEAAALLPRIEEVPTPPRHHHATPPTTPPAPSRKRRTQPRKPKTERANANANPVFNLDEAAGVAAAAAMPDEHDDTCL
jgi:hypothetical protein